MGRGGAGQTAGVANRRAGRGAGSQGIGGGGSAECAGRAGAGALPGRARARERGLELGRGGAPEKGVCLGIRKVWTPAHPGGFVNTSGFGLPRSGSG